MSLFDENELLRSHWYLYWGNIAYKQEAYSLSGENFFMSETENSCSRLCHPFFSRQKIPKSCNQRSLHLIDKVTNKPKCLSTSTAACQTSSIATRCPV
uniref:Predicted gene, 58608 n=1 Tax=Mus musculus TaxID=10090 RepID=A0A9L6KDY4_MOUSE